MNSVYIVIVTGATFGAAGFMLGVRAGMESFKRILIRELDKLDDEDALFVAVIKAIVRGEEDEDDE